MRQQKIILLLVVVAIGLTIILSTGVGYASVSNFKHDDVIHSPELAEFRVKFYGEPIVSGEGKANVKYTGETTARMNITGLEKAGDSVKVMFTIKNTSRDLRARLYKTVLNSNNEYFKVSATLSREEIAARNGQATITIEVKLIKTPVTIQKTNISVKIVASPEYICH